jgi:hypothetical protein
MDGPRGNSHEKGIVNRRSFMRHSLVAGAAATVGAGILANGNFAVAQGASDKLRKGDVAILQFLAAAEIIPAKATGGNPLYMQDLLPLDSDMSQYMLPELGKGIGEGIRGFKSAMTDQQKPVATGNNVQEKG